MRRGQSSVAALEDGAEVEGRVEGEFAAEGGDRFAAARSIADAVLYEGYVLYPYRASSKKNQSRWQFGVLTPRAFSETDGSERWSMRTECLVESEPARTPAVTVRIRCLQVQRRNAEVVVPHTGAVPAFTPVDVLDSGGHQYVSWDEAVEQVVDLPTLDLPALDLSGTEFGAPGPTGDHLAVGAASDGYMMRFSFPASHEVESIVAADGTLAGRVVRHREPIEGQVRVRAEPVSDGPRFVKVVVTVENATSWTGTATHRDAVMDRSLVAVHVLAAVDAGAFVSLLDPPDYARDAVAGCHSDGVFPVLVGGNGVVLASPIILYDQPEVAPESPGDLYDSTEIDEILALRVLTLTDEEKAEARGTDGRAAAIIDRCDNMAPEEWERLHGGARSPRTPGEPSPPVFVTPPDRGEEIGDPVVAGAGVPEQPWWDPAVDAAVDPWSDTVVVAGIEVAKGTPVRLRPSRRSDAQDLFLAGLAATVAGVFTDVDGSRLVAVTVDGDPAAEELNWQGRYLFFHPEEVDPVMVRDDDSAVREAAR